ncbi:MAG TPA: hypothetical protein VG963_01115, partial [Polyangiaceae bacterium]|nr:hypothetical protein [Polyangiaceae bacterium]
MTWRRIGGRLCAIRGDGVENNGKLRGLTASWYVYFIMSALVLFARFGVDAVLLPGTVAACLAFCLVVWTSGRALRARSRTAQAILLGL